MGFVYVLNATGTSYYKIGFCKNMFRVDELKRQYTFSIEVTTIIQGENYKEIENLLHKYFSKQRVTLQVKFDGYTEWFNLTDKQVKALSDITNYDELLAFTRSYIDTQVFPPAPEEKNLKRQTYYLTEKQIAAINNMAFHEKIDKSEIVRTALEKYLPQKYL